jgi:hypothetical protein
VNYAQPNGCSLRVNPRGTPAPLTAVPAASTLRYIIQYSIFIIHWQGGFHLTALRRRFFSPHSYKFKQKLPYGTMYPYPFRGRSYGETTRLELHFAELEATRLLTKHSSHAQLHWIHFRFPNRFVFRLSLIGKHLVATMRPKSNRQHTDF